MELKDISEYYIGYIEDEQFWCREKASSFDESKEKLLNLQNIDKSKKWEIYEKFSIYRKLVVNI
jgi:hypothetical protein